MQDQMDVLDTKIDRILELITEIKEQLREQQVPLHVMNNHVHNVERCIQCIPRPYNFLCKFWRPSFPKALLRPLQNNSPLKLFIQE